MHAFRCYIFAAWIACDSGPTCSTLFLLFLHFSFHVTFIEIINVDINNKRVYLKKLRLLHL